MTRQDAAEVLEPGEQSFDLPATTVTAKRAAILGLHLPAAAIRCDQLDAFFGEAFRERVAVVGLVADEALGADAIGALDRIIRERASSAEPSGPDASAHPSYTRRLLADRNLRLKKLGEEVAELIGACADEDPSRAAEEAADLVYHALVALRATGGGWDDVRRILWQRSGSSGRVEPR